ncbi:hypothetical protein ACVXHA_10725 [Escherichia coli]
MFKFDNSSANFPVCRGHQRVNATYRFRPGAIDQMNNTVVDLLVAC